MSADTIEMCRLDFEHQAMPDLQILDEIDSSVLRMRSPPKRGGANDKMQRYAFPIVGREEQLKTIGDAISRGSGQNEIFTIIGEPGIGKSRLATAVIDEAVSQKTIDQLLVFRGDMQKRTTPFAVMRDLILNALKLGEQAPKEQIVTAFQGAGIDSIAPELLETFRLSDERGQSLDGGSNLSLKETAEALVETFAQVALNGRTLLLVEDLHLVDPESLLCLALLKDVASRHPFLCWPQVDPRLPVTRRISPIRSCGLTRCPENRCESWPANFGRPALRPNKTSKKRSIRPTGFTSCLSSLPVRLARMILSPSCQSRKASSP
ncbi:MAG: ATP-binding protein [Hyphomicrobiales bacterium]|nr:ATP-binding protein [Hyphomicrobiales bacterium]